MEEATYLIVNRQLQDLVRVQENILAKASAKCNSKNETVVPLGDYERLSRQLENEAACIHVNASYTREQDRFGNLKHIATEESQAKTQFMDKCG
ncbi:hypothetical protein QZH41_018848, partial [Actinostola sp. cb2023]